MFHILPPSPEAVQLQAQGIKLPPKRVEFLLEDHVLKDWEKNPAEKKDIPLGISLSQQIVLKGCILESSHYWKYNLFQVIAKVEDIVKHEMIKA